MAHGATTGLRYSPRSHTGPARGGEGGARVTVWLRGGLRYGPRSHTGPASVVAPWALTEACHGSVGPSGSPRRVTRFVRWQRRYSSRSQAAPTTPKRPSPPVTESPPFMNYPVPFRHSLGSRRKTGRDSESLTRRTGQRGPQLTRSGEIRPRARPTRDHLGGRGDREPCKEGLGGSFCVS